MPDTYYDLAKHFERIATELKAQALQSSILGNSSGVGTDREEVYRGFLERHLPKNCDAFLGGYVFDMEGIKSKQIDIIVTAGPTPRFLLADEGRHIAPLEGTIATIESKTMLDSAALRDSLDKCASIPPMPSQESIVPPMLRIPQAKWDDFPFKIIVAYDGNSKENICENINEFYRVNDDIPRYRRPNLIHVIGKYFIMRMTEGFHVVNSDGTTDPNQPNVGTYRWFDRGPDAIAIALTLSTLQSNAFLSNFLKYDFDNWINQISGRILEME